MPLTKAQSGHLCLELDHYDKIQQSTGGVPARERVLYSGQSAADSSLPSTATSRTVDAGTQTDPGLLLLDYPVKPAPSLILQTGRVRHPTVVGNIS